MEDDSAGSRQVEEHAADGEGYQRSVVFIYLQDVEH